MFWKLIGKCVMAQLHQPFLLFNLYDFSCGCSCQIFYFLVIFLKQVLAVTVRLSNILVNGSIYIYILNIVVDKSL